ncbi:MAG: peptide/nickel transport system substrate-binding protein [Bacteroidia bacterium]|jgi:peptide/nickel transport system substrate-binding protein
MYRKENRKSFAALAFLGSAMFGLVSCGSNSSTSEGGATSDDAIAEVGALTYVKIDDAAEVDPTWSDENTVVYHFIGEPDDMHPTNGNSASKTFLHGYTQKYIMSSDIINLDARPDVVKDWPVISEDELSFTYELRDDPKWDDGAQLSMEDVIFTFMANKCPLTNNPHAKPYLENLEAIIIDAENPRKFTLKMKKKYIHNIFFLTDYPLLQEAFWDPSKTMRSYSFAQFDDSKFDTNSEAALNTWATEFNDAKYSRKPEFLVGMGQYRFSEWKPGQSFTLVRKEGHYTQDLTNPTAYETSYPERIIFKINTDPNSQALEFKTQALDASTYLSTKKMMELQDDQNFNNNYHSRFTNTYNYSYLGFNCRPDGIEHKKFFDDKRVRRAIAMLISVDEMNVVLNKGKNKRMVGPVSPLKKEYNTDLSLIDRDLEGAKALLEEAGWTDTDGDNIVDKIVDGEKLSFEFDLHYMTTQVTWRDQAQMIAEALYEAGVKCNITPLDFAVHYDRARNHKFDAMLAAWAGSSAPEDFTQIWHTESWASKGSNFTGFGDASTDALIDSIKYTIDTDLRHPMVERLQEKVYDEQPYVFFFASTRRNVIHKRFGNADMYFERPGVIISNLRLLANGAISAPAAEAN